MNRFAPALAAALAACAAGPRTSTATSTPTATATATPAAQPAGDSAPTVRTPRQLARDKELEARAAALVDAFQNRFPGIGGAITHDGKGVVFASTRDGSPQLYVGDLSAPAAAPRQLTRGERVQTAALTRDGKYVLFTRDRGADENSHLYRVALDGSGLTDLTPGEGVRHDPPVLPLRRPDLVVHGRRTVKSPASTLLVRSVQGGPERVVYEDAAPAYVADAAPDGSRALVIRATSASDLVLLELDLAGGKAPRRLWPPEGKKEAVATAAYSADGRTAFVATDQGGEENALLALELSTAQVKARWTPDPATARVDAVAASPAGDVLAVHVDAGNRDLIRLLDATTLRARASPQAPIGASELGDFTPDGSRIVFTLSTPDRPGDTYALDVATGKVQALRADPRPTLSMLTPVETTVTSVPAFDGKPIPVHVYLPRGATGRLPVMVEFHGGPSASSSVAWKSRAQFFVSQGYAWVEPNVRGSTGFGRAWEMADNLEKRGDVLKDMASVNAWVKAQAWADPRRVVIFGGSYGGWVVLQGLTQQPDLWRAGVDLVGVADLRTLLRSTDQAIRAFFVDEFGDLDRDAALLARWSPLPNARNIRAPLFVYQGANDPRVLRSESDAIVAAARAHGTPVEYMIAANEGHSLDRRENQLEFYSRVARFLEEHLK